MLLNKHLKASSLANTILICLLISVFCGCLVLISHYQNLLNNKLYLQEELISRNTSAFNYFLSNIETIDHEDTQELDIFEDGIISFGKRKAWGFYDVLTCKTVFKGDTIYKAAIIGSTKTKETPALYVTDYSKPLKLSGESKIFGDMKVPTGRTEQAYLNGTTGNKVTISGRASKSDKKLPKISKTINISTTGLSTISINDFELGPIINAFDKATKVIEVSSIPVLNDLICKGNIIIKSNNPLEIGHTSKLSDVLIIAPKVTIQKGFKGNVHIVAKQDINIEPEVSLHYPSSLYIKNDTDSVAVNIQKNSKIIGGVVIDGNTYSGSLKRSLTIDEKATVIGNVYCYGSTQLRGEIIGSIYTDRFFLKTESSEYENVILNGIIDKKNRPNKFIELPLFLNTMDTSNYVIIKDL